MKVVQIHFVSILGLLVSVSARPEEEVGNIIQGRQAEPNEFPFVCSIQDRLGELRCGGIIITANTILTACHCLGKYFTDQFKLFNPKNMIVVAGSEDMKGYHGQKREAAYIINHDKCKQVTHGWTYDYGVINLLRPFFFADNIKPIKIYSRDLRAVKKELQRMQRSRTKCTAVGWGTQNVTSGTYSNISSHLKVIETTMIPDDECQQLYCKHEKDMCNKLDLRGQFCALGVNGSDVCTGDSGGPIICNGFVFGITSWGIACGEIGVPSVFSSIEHAFQFALPRRNDIVQMSKSSPPYIIPPWFSIILIAVLHFLYYGHTINFGK
ncbi:chymotrypsin-1-like [Cimex lectularius]|uniref:Peptidase S1 domain-containing protein n=1 Tax=Cimex lectularius TaxID=79782 RepID=A0A8I6SBW5_CIMLE|nr:chymotrypsin-1-like [Cimex lectularius]